MLTEGTKARWVKDRDSYHDGVKAVGKLVVLYVDSAREGVLRWSVEPKDTSGFGGNSPVMRGEAGSEAAAKAAAIKAAPKLAGKVKMMREEVADDLTEAVKHGLTKMLPWADDPEFGGMNAI